MKEIRVANLKKELKKWQCPTGGLKNQFLVHLKESIENGVPMYDSVAGEEGGYGIMHQDDGVFQVGALWQPIVAAEVLILDPENASHLQGPKVTSD